MQYFLLSIIALPFLWINYKIVKTDIKEKKIPNKLLGYLLLLLPFWWGFLFISPDFIKFGLEINFLLFLGQIILTFLVSFIIYYFGIWSAGDAKYLLVLALFLAHIGIIPFIGNIALLTIGYLLIYFVWFYLGKCLFNWRYTKSLYGNIYNDLKDKTIIFLQHGDGNFYKKIMFLKILKWILLFLIIFVSIRLARLYIFADIMESTYYMKILSYLHDYAYYFLFALIGLFFGLIYLIRLIINKIKNVISKKSKIKNNFIIDFILISILLFCLLRFIIYEYIINPNEIISYLIRIFTFYIIIYLMFRILKYSYKITFSTAETYYVDIKDLKEGDIVDKEYLVKIFGTQASLGYNKDGDEKKGILGANPNEYFEKIENPIGKENVKKLHKIYKIVNKFHKKNNGTKENNVIKVLNTFAFGGYIFVGFLISFLFGNSIIGYLIQYFIRLFI